MSKVSLAMLGATLLVGTSSLALAQSSPAPQQPAGRNAMEPGDAFGATYGTDNLSQPSAVVPSATTLAQQHFQLQQKDLLAAQNVRTQPPATLEAYTAYLQRDPLIADLRKLVQINPNADPASVVLLAWNHVALDMASIDHTTAGRKEVINGVPTTVFEFTYGEQFGPPRSSRAMAMVHLAMFEAANAIDQKYHSYAPAGGPDLLTGILAKVGSKPTSQNASMSEAIMIAAHNTLVALYPHKRALINVSRLEMSVLVAAQEQANGTADAASRIALGQRIGAAAAAAVVELRASDGSQFADPTNACPNPPPTTYPAPGPPPPICYEKLFPVTLPAVPPLTWTADIIVPNRLQLGANWSKVIPFVLTKSQFISPGGLALPSGVVPPPTQTDPAFLTSLNEPGGYGPLIPDPHDPAKPKIPSKYGVKAYGGFGPDPGTILQPPPGQGLRALTPSKRTAEQTRFAQFWGYDATALLCAPPRLYNMIATSYILDTDHVAQAPKDAVGTARYLALVNLALADAGIEAWEAKFQYAIARPITYIRSQPNDPTEPQYDNWTPLGQVASNGAPANVTPPFPAYPSGHAVFGAAVFQMIGHVLGYALNDAGGKFDFISDEYNGRIYGMDGKLRPLLPVHYTSLSAAEWENAESRIWLGIHWQRDADDGIALGNEIADTIYGKVLTPM